MIEIKTQEQAKIENALAQSRKAEFVGETDDFAKEVNRKIRERYSISDELAILRKALAKLNIKFNELDEYNAYVENCKQEVRNQQEQKL